MHKADTETFKQNFEMYFLLLLNSDQKRAYLSYKSLDEKKAYMQLYWKAANPNPLLPENDWILEFNRRSHELTTEIKLTRARTPAAAHDPIQAENKLEIFDQIAQFRGPGGRTRIDLTLIVPFKKNLVRKFKKSAGKNRRWFILKSTIFELLVLTKAFKFLAQLPNLKKSVTCWRQ